MTNNPDDCLYFQEEYGKEEIEKLKQSENICMIYISNQGSYNRNFTLTFTA